MAVLVLDPDLESDLKAVRRESNSDGHDEVWDGLYVMAPLPNDDHQEIQAKLVAVLQQALGWDSPAKIRAGVNVSDRHRDWNLPLTFALVPGKPRPRIEVVMTAAPAETVGTRRKWLI